MAELERAMQTFSLTYGRDDRKLEKWQLLCRDCGVESSSNIKKCKAALRTVSINIWDLIRARETGQVPVTGYENKSQLRKDLKNPSRRFPLAQLKTVEENKLLKALLVVIV
ncbi:hypothetical protein D0869_09565 [Hortaea werneckii]|uniref:Uncharacterized protein n=1 Tax=Hortaea werneckii TaxID=91943 RepID=A0A3M6WHU5_HORWE|nr:hypothetical protein D0869_09565 [Hortaea werneckii]